MMHARILLALMPTLVFIGCSRRSASHAPATPQTPAVSTTMPNADSQVDQYLEKWDQFAQGSKELVPYLRDNKKPFEDALTEMLKSGNRQAPARMVFYPVVQVGGSIPADSPLGVAAMAVLGNDFKVTTTKDGKRVLFAADLFGWWEKHQGDYDHFFTFDDWQSRDFAKTTVLPMYHRLQRQPG